MSDLNENIALSAEEMDVMAVTIAENLLKRCPDADIKSAILLIILRVTFRDNSGNPCSALREEYSILSRNKTLSLRQGFASWSLFPRLIRLTFLHMFTVKIFMTCYLSMRNLHAFR